MRLRSLVVVAVVVAMACACASSNSTSPTPAGNATLHVMLKDSPFSDAKALLVTFSEFNAHAAGSGFGNEPRLPFASDATSLTCDLKKLTNAQALLGTGALPAGHYTQLRLVVSSATLYFDNASSGGACAPTIAAPAGRSAAIDIPSGELRLNREFDLTGTTPTTILLDFDGDRSVRDTGNGRFMMTPVITVDSVH
jgi:Domain of unknown function (DUF4382)